jgi:hypothetical protein
MNISNPQQLSDEAIVFLLTERLRVLYEERRLASFLQCDALHPFSIKKGISFIYPTVFEVSRHQLYILMTEERVIIN